MIVSVSTVKDSLSNVERFVARNLAGGIDHLVVFVDSALPDVEEFLGGLAHVTCVPAYGEWWGDTRPDRLNERQRINAAMTGRLLAELPSIEWLFHIDGDEAVQLDRALLDTLDLEWRAVLLAPLEVVSGERGEGDPAWFKRRLDPDELARLQSLGVIARPVNGSYFRGHLRGKVGVRPAADVQLGIHGAVDATGAPLATYRDDALRVLHYESPDHEEFARKWLALLESGSTVGQRHRRARLFRTIATLLEQDLGEEETRASLQRLYERTAVDDVATLLELGLLERVDPPAPTETPLPLPESVRRELSVLLERMRHLPKRAAIGPPAERVAAGRAMR